MPFWLKSKALTWANPEREPPADTSVSHKCMQEGDQEEEETTTIVLPGSLTEASFVESLVAYHIKGIIDCISEEVLGIDRKLLKLPGISGVVNPHLALVRLSWGRGRGRTDYSSFLPPVVIRTTMMP